MPTSEAAGIRGVDHGSRGRVRLWKSCPQHQLSPAETQNDKNAGGYRSSRRCRQRRHPAGSATGHPAAQLIVWQAKTTVTRGVAALLACRTDRWPAARRGDLQLEWPVGLMSLVGLVGLRYLCSGRDRAVCEADGTGEASETAPSVRLVRLVGLVVVGLMVVGPAGSVCPVGTVVSVMGLVGPTEGDGAAAYCAASTA